jgi:hypothetical protein
VAHLLIGFTYHDVMTRDPWRTCSFVFVGPSWWIVLGEQALLGLPWGRKSTGWMPRAHMLDEEDQT